MIYDIAVIGGGASGLAAAVEAGRRGASVLLLEKLSRPGKKLLATGNGRCNFTNEKIGNESDAACYRGVNPEFAAKITSSYDCSRVLDFFESLGIYHKKIGSYVYPSSMQARVLRDALWMEISSISNVTVICDCNVTALKEKRGFEIASSAGVFKSRRLILCCGGISGIGKDKGSAGYGLCKDLNLKVTNLFPALCPLVCREKIFKKLKGIRTDGLIELYIDGALEASDRGELQLAEYGISGIPVFQVSRFASQALEAGSEVYAVMDFLPDISEKKLAKLIKMQADNHPGYNISQILSGFINSKLAEAISEIALKEKITAITAKDAGKIAAAVKNFKTEIISSRGFEYAQVTGGGIDVSQVHCRDMSVGGHRGLYAAGEILDIDGICGGYNLHFAWSTGIIAGRSACMSIGK